MEDDDSSHLPAFLQLARRLPDVVAEGWEGKGKRDPFPAPPRLFWDHDRLHHRLCFIALNVMRSCLCKSPFCPVSTERAEG